MSETRPLIVVKRRYFDQFLSGEKNIEYRRLRGQFNAAVFRPGRSVRIAYNYNLKLFPFLDATVTAFEALTALNCPDLLSLHPDISPSETIAAIHLCIAQ